MTTLRPARKPVFLWQAGLILLPVLVIAAVAITVIIRNRAEVEREARGRAEEVARQYGKELAGPWGSFLMRHDSYSQTWCYFLANEAGAWPGKRPTIVYSEAAQAPPGSPQGQLAEWQAQFPDWRAEDVFPDSFGLTAGGAFRDGLELNPAPQPPAWLTSLSGPGADAATNAAFLSLRARLPTLPPEQAVAEALRFAQSTPANLSEAGLPLANLAFAEALRYSRRTGPSQALWNEIPSQVLRAPSPLIPGMLDQLEELAGTNGPLRASVVAWRTLWTARLKLFDIAAAVRHTGKLRGITTTNLWVDEGQTRWLCILNPEYANPLAAANGGTVETTNEVWTQVRFLPQPVVERALVRALENSGVKLPDYLGLTVWLEGEPLTLPERWSPRLGTNSAPLLLAEASGRLSNPARLSKGPGSPEIEWEGLPSHPRFVLQLCVADPALLYASYRRHALLLAGLVAAAAFGALIGVFATWRAFQRQLHLNELKSNFVSSVSHELRSPIASVRLMAESLERGKVSDAPKQREYFRFIVQECRRLSSLIENVLDLSRIEQGRKQYDFEPTDLLALTQQTVKLMDTYAAERSVSLRLLLPPDPQPSTLNSQLPYNQLPADGKALQQALINLIDNALKHSPKGGTVTVGLGEESDQWSVISDQKSESKAAHAPRSTLHAPVLHLWVEDHGGGIPPSEHEKIFERFYRRGSELRRQTQGVGIGLSIVKHIVEAHGGKVMVRSAVGQGSRFTIELPVALNNTKAL